ncbi:MAG: cofactor-independent phosphoglycerate mutase [Magnetococcales bacterium]|nr:cofactor-independent phosphoglycerate mutase [Magnetococcales bacterium]
MKFVIFLGDGMSDHPIAELDGKTPLMVAHTPNMDRMVREGVGGWSRNTPAGLYPGSDVTNLAILGYEAARSYTGRSPLEAAAMGIELGSNDMAFRCNLVTLGNEHQVMDSFNADHISSEEAALLIDSLNQHLVDHQTPFRFFAGVGYRHILIWNDGASSVDHLSCTPPHDISGQSIGPYWPVGTGSDRITQLMRDSWSILADHPVNQQRRQQGLAPANSIWLWGHGGKPQLQPFHERYGKSGGMISAVDLLRGIAAHIGFESIRVPGATGWIDTNYAGKASACLDGLQRHDLIFVHVEAPDEAGHAGRLDYKIQAIADLDRHIVGPVLSALDHTGQPFRALALPDHITLLRTKTHESGPVPFALYGAGILPDANQCYDERLLTTGSLSFDPGHKLMSWFLNSRQ